MADFLSKLIRKEDVAEGTMAFYLEKPEDFTYLPGQHPTFQILNPSETDEEGDSRTFSFITIPSDKEIGFATRMRDTAFKRILKNAELGLEMAIKNPRGSMVLPTDPNRPLVFLAGGIGITPLISMIREASSQKSAQKITLFYANRTIAQAAFFTQLEELAKENPNFTFVPVMTQEDANIWHGETGHITSELVKKYVPSTDNTLFYLAGPTGMVSAMTQILTESGIDSLFIKSEDYGEYK
jgi:ferredoxin-NADP reductase